MILKAFKKGISEPIFLTVVLAIIIFSISIVYLAVVPFISSMSEESTSVRILDEGFTLWDSQSRLLDLQIERGSDDSEMNGLELVFNLEGNSYNYIYEKPIEPNTKKVLYFDLTEIPGKFDGCKIAPLSGKKRGAYDSMESKEFEQETLQITKNSYIKILDPENYGVLNVYSFWQEGKKGQRNLPANGSKIVVFNNEEIKVDEKKTNDEGFVSFKLIPGTYSLRLLYNNELWKSENVEIFNKGLLEKQLSREEPIAEMFSVKKDNVDVTNGDLFSEEPVNISLRVKNLKDEERKIRGNLIIDRDKLEEYDIFEILGETSVPPKKDAYLTKDLIFNQPGEYSLKVEISAEIDGEWVKTDEWEWSPILTVK